MCDMTYSHSNVRHDTLTFVSKCVLQGVAGCCSVLSCERPTQKSRQSVLQCVTVCCSVLQCVAGCCGVLQCVAGCCREL